MAKAAPAKKAACAKKDAYKVEGEEDLALLPCILMAPVGTNIVYGWPGRCMMLVTTDEDIRIHAMELMAKMEEKE